MSARGLNPRLAVAPEVAAALAAGRPVVALESTIIAHGFAWPDNLTLGQGMIAAVREAGVEPAPIAVADGAVRVGFDDAMLERLARDDARKCSTRDLAPAIASGALGATTVAATMRIAHLVGIEVFATGGIGGVHPRRGLDWPLDESADLSELARTPLTVVCSGAKSILDLPATMERLDSLSVPVIGYGCDSLPAFHARDSGLPVSARIDDADAFAALARAHWALGGAGIVIAQPPPTESAIPFVELAGWLDAAQDDARRQEVSGAALTPYLLARLAALSGGRTVAVNRALALANAGLGAALAIALARAPGG